LHVLQRTAEKLPHVTPSSCLELVERPRSGSRSSDLSRLRSRRDGECWHGLCLALRCRTVRFLIGRQIAPGVAHYAWLPCTWRQAVVPDRRHAHHGGQKPRCALATFADPTAIAGPGLAASTVRGAIPRRRSSRGPKDLGLPPTSHPTNPPGHRLQVSSRVIMPVAGALTA